MSTTRFSPLRHFLKSRITPSLRGRLLLLVLFSLLPAFGFLLYASFAERSHVEDEARDEALRLVRTVALEQKHLIANAHQQLLTLAQLPIVKRPEWSALCNQTFAELRRQHPYYANLAIADLRGDVRCSAIPPKKPINVADRGYFREALAKNDFTVGGYQIGRHTGRSTINAGYPVRDTQGVTRGVVFIAIDLLSWLTDLAATLQLTDGTALLVMNERGTVLARHPDSEAWIGKTLPDTPLIQHILAHHGEGSIEITGLDGVSRLQVYTPIHTTIDGQTYLVAGIPTAAAYRDVDKTLLRGLGLLALIAALVLTLGWFGAGFLIVQPTRILIRAAERLGGGDLAARTNLARAKGELGTLARSIDRMAENLEHNDRELRRVNRALKTLSAGNRAMLRATDEQGLLDETCRMFVEEGGYSVALVLYRQGDAAKTLRAMAAAGYPGGLAAIQKLRVSWADDDYGRGSAGIAVRTGQTRLTRNALSDPNYDVWHAVAPAYPSDVSMPLRVAGEIIGVLAITASEPDAFQPEELSLLEESAQDLAFGIETLRARAAHRAADEALWRMTHYDAVTGLPNEAHFSESMAAAIDSAEKHNQPFAILQLDIERLREINDALGFNHGDELLRQFGERLCAVLPEQAVTARLRADEFAALLPDANANSAIEAARRIEAVLAKPFLIADLALDVPSHIGIVLFPEHGNTPHDLFRHMDMALQQAKKKSIGHAIFDHAQNHGRSQRLSLTGELRRAIEGGDLLLYLQPKVEMASGRVSGAEGLVRWQHTERGLIPPGEFIGLAEHTGLIKPLTEWVIEAALRLNHAWQGQGCALPIAVNLSARNLREEELLDRIKRLQATWDARPGLLELEITESAIMEDAEFALQVLQRLRDIGIPLHIDDFGTGYSSLSHLQKLPVHTIKIDQSFVHGMITSRDSAVIVRSTIDLAHDLGRKVVAEGVEDRETWDRLAALGCDMAQGYFISRPMPSGDFPGWVGRFQPPAPRPTR